MRAISRARWDAFAAYCRRPLAAVLTQELAWFEADGGQVLATLIVDTDGEFSGIVLARDGLERFRWVGATRYFDTPESALIDLNQKIQDLLKNLDEQRHQGDESGQAVDFFKPIVDKRKLHPHFSLLTSGERFTAARAIISSMMRWHDDIDGNFVEQFQTTGFDARMWELYLFAVLTEANLDVSRPEPAPDFLARGLNGEFALEATTINPSGGGRQQQSLPNPRTEAEWREYARHYLPIRYAGPLTSKLRKEYWKYPSVTGRPLVLAIQDFHAPMSMTRSGSALPTYLYGVIHEARRHDAGGLVIDVSEIDEHRWHDKVVPSKYFSLPGAENVSAVVFNSCGTISKFNRMGVSAGFGAENVVLIRRGLAWNTEPDAVDPVPFVHIVSEGYAETWIEGMDVFHNPNALHPLDPALLPGAAHHRLRSNGQLETISEAGKPLESPTTVLTLPLRAEGLASIREVAD